MLHFNRQELLSSDEAARLRELAKHILQEIGMNACHAGPIAPGGIPYPRQSRFI